MGTECAASVWQEQASCARQAVTCCWGIPIPREGSQVEACPASVPVAQHLLVSVPRERCGPWRDVAAAGFT